VNDTPFELRLPIFGGIAGKIVLLGHRTLLLSLYNALPVTHSIFFVKKGVLYTLRYSNYFKIVCQFSQ